MTQTASATTPATIPETMRASVLTDIKTLSIEQVPTPPMASDEVLVEVAAVGVCGSDTHYYRHGRIGDFVVTSPLILGHELSGRIVAVGEEVPETRIGERVAIEPQKNCRRCRECRAGRYNLCTNMEFYATPPIDGAFAQYCVIRTEFAHKIPDSMSDEAAALLEPLSVAITTMRKAGVTPGSSILIAGAGPIGIISAQAARAFGAAEILVTDLVLERRERGTACGDVRHQGRTAGRHCCAGRSRLVRDEPACRADTKPGDHRDRHLPLHRHLAGRHTHGVQRRSRAGLPRHRPIW